MINLDKEACPFLYDSFTTLTSLQLRNFAQAARQLGSSVGILSSSFHLRERLAQILWLFRENAADLFPRKVVRQPREMLVDTSVRHWKKSKRHKALPHVTNPTVGDDLDAEDFPRQLQLFAHDVTTFLDCLNEFPEFTDEAVNASILSLEGDLRVNVGANLVRIMCSSCISSIGPLVLRHTRVSPTTHASQVCTGD